MGYNVAKAPISPVEVQDNTFVFFGQEAKDQEQTGNVFKDIPTDTLDSKPYRQITNI